LALPPVTPRPTRDGHHSASRCRLANISSHVASTCIGLPQIRIDRRSRSVAVKVSWDFTRAGLSRGTSATDAFTWLLDAFVCPSVCRSASVRRGESTTRCCRTCGAGRFVESFAYQHFSPRCPGNRKCHAGCDPGCAAHTASALGRHSLWAGPDRATSMAAIGGGLTIGLRKQIGTPYTLRTEAIADFNGRR